MKIKTTMRYHYIPIRVEEENVRTILNASEHSEELELPYTANENATWYSHSGTQVGCFHKVKHSHKHVHANELY